MNHVVVFAKSVLFDILSFSDLGGGWWHPLGPVGIVFSIA